MPEGQGIDKECEMNLIWAGLLASRAGSESDVLKSAELTYADDCKPADISDSKIGKTAFVNIDFDVDINFGMMIDDFLIHIGLKSHFYNHQISIKNC